MNEKTYRVSNITYNQNHRDYTVLLQAVRTGAYLQIIVPDWMGFRKAIQRTFISEKKIGYTITDEEFQQLTKSSPLGRE